MLRVIVITRVRALQPFSEATKMKKTYPAPGRASLLFAMAGVVMLLLAWSAAFGAPIKVYDKNYPGYYQPFNCLRYDPDSKTHGFLRNTCAYAVEAHSANAAGVWGAWTIAAGKYYPIFDGISGPLYACMPNDAVDKKNGLCKEWGAKPPQLDKTTESARQQRDTASGSGSRSDLLGDEEDVRPKDNRKFDLYGEIMERAKSWHETQFELRRIPNAPLIQKSIEESLGILEKQHRALLAAADRAAERVAREEQQRADERIQERYALAYAEQRNDNYQQGQERSAAPGVVGSRNRTSNRSSSSSGQICVRSSLEPYGPGRGMVHAISNGCSEPLLAVYCVVPNDPEEPLGLGDCRNQTRQRAASTVGDLDGFSLEPLSVSDFQAHPELSLPVGYLDKLTTIANDGMGHGARIFVSACTVRGYLAGTCLPDARKYWREQGSPR